MALANGLNYKTDIAYGAFGIEGRAPFLDHRLGEWAGWLRPEELVRGREKKILLRAAYAGDLPAGGAEPAQAGLRRADRAMAARPAAGTGRGYAAVPAARPETTEPPRRTAVVDAADVRAVGAGMEGVMVKITVLMAVRDTPPEMLREAIESIRRQTLREFEFLILDDGSERPETCAELERQAAADSRVRLVRGPPRGLTPTLNRGLALATGRADRPPGCRRLERAGPAGAASRVPRPASSNRLMR